MMSTYFFLICAFGTYFLGQALWLSFTKNPSYKYFAVLVLDSNMRRKLGTLDDSNIELLSAVGRKLRDLARSLCFLLSGVCMFLMIFGTLNSSDSALPRYAGILAGLVVSIVEQLIILRLQERVLAKYPL